MHFQPDHNGAIEEMTPLKIAIIAYQIHAAYGVSLLTVTTTLKIGSDVNEIKPKQIEIGTMRNNVLTR
jgi:hypothetical protein